MDFWENTILQWLNCLYDKTEIVSLDQLKDGKIYYDLINQIIPWNCKKHNDRFLNIVLQFIEDEYPNFIMHDKNDNVENLSLASLILARLSLDPIFHKSLCSKLDLDSQVKVKFILEPIYSLGKKITNEDVCKIFSLPNNTNLSTPNFTMKSKLVLKEFLNSPATRSVQNDNKIHDQNRLIRNLRADLETSRYEKSELVEDLKNRDKQIKELQQQLQKTSTELKSLKADSTAFNLNSSLKDESIKSFESLYKQEHESLEKYTNELQNDFYKLQDEKIVLTDEITNLKKKYYELEETNKNNDQTIESMSIQMEKKEEELLDLKIKYDEINNFLKENTKIYFNNHSFDVEDKIMEISMNRSETLSSVIEVQLLDTKKEVTNLQNENKMLNNFLTILIEEYEKLNRKFLVPENSDEINNCSNSALNEKISNEEKTISTSEKDSNEEQIISPHEEDIISILNTDFLDLLKKNNNMTIFLNFMKSMKLKNSKILENNSAPLEFKVKISNNKIDILQKLKENTVKLIDENALVSKFYHNLNQENCRNQLSNIFKIFFKEIMIELLELSEKNKTTNKFSNQSTNNFSVNNIIIREVQNFIRNNFKNEINHLNPEEYFSLIKIENNFVLKDAVNSLTIGKEIAIAKALLNSVIKDNIIESFKSIVSANENKNNSNNDLSLTKTDLIYIQTTWTSLYQCVLNNIKTYKVLVLLEKSWRFSLESFEKIFSNNLSDPFKIKGLFQKMNEIECDLKNTILENFTALSDNLASILQFLVILNKYCHPESLFNEEKNSTTVIKELSKFSNPLLNDGGENNQLPSTQQLDFCPKIIKIQRKIINFEKLSNASSLEIELTTEPQSTPNSLSTENEKIDDNKQSNENMIDINQMQNHIKEIHEKYELKLEKMKEKMKAVYNNQITAMKKDQEKIALGKLEALQTKLEKQCLNHVEELNKYKKHISELTTQLWDVGEKLIIEKQKKEAYHQKYVDFKSKYSNIDISKRVSPDLENSVVRSDDHRRASQLPETSFSKIPNLKGFHMMGNAFKTEDEEGEVFDTTCLADLQRPRESLSSIDINRLSILQSRNAKCKPHLKSSYPVETNFHPAPMSEDEIKNGNAEDFLNDSLSQSLLTGKKVKRKDRSKNLSETPRARRFSNIFRKPRSSTEDRQSKMT